MLGHGSAQSAEVPAPVAIARRWRIPPGLALFLIAPIVGEVLSSNTRPLVYILPVPFAALTLLYGPGALLIRELTLRWRKGWPTVLALGSAYAILEEGLVVKTFFNPTWYQLGELAHYGRAAGVNWVWSAVLIAQHATLSIAIPILLVTLAYPNRRDEPWVGRRTFWLLPLVLLLDCFALSHLFPVTVRPIAFALATLAAALLVVVARLLPVRLIGHRLAPPGRSVRAGWFLPVGLAGTVALYMLPHLTFLPAVADIAVMAAAAFALAWVVARMSGGWSWSDRHRLALAAGMLAFYMTLLVIRTVSGVVDSVVILAAGLYFLIRLDRDIRKRKQEAPAGAGFAAQ
jgi:hypothetical protein